jgi:methylglutaconyl-CoA hydratase
MSAMSSLAINATEWRTAEWDKEKGLYNDIYDNVNDLDAEITRLANQLNQSNPEAMSLLKKVFWEGTENWDVLLKERAAMSGKLVLSIFSKNSISKFKKK